MLEPDSERIIAAARPTACDRVVMRGRLDDWDFFMGEIAFDANHTDDRGFQRRLDAIIERLDLALRRATD